MPHCAATIRFDGTPPRFRCPPAARLASRNGWTLLIDGRIDNRTDVAGRLSLPGDTDDATLVVHAIETWDLAAPARLAGDFAFVAWDSRRRRILLGRDHLGIRTLYFTADPDQVRADTEISPLLAGVASPAVDEQTAAGFLCGELDNGSGTLFRDVRRVPPGHVVVVDGAGTRCQAYWTGEPRSSVRYSRDDEYEAHCRELLKESIACRIEPDVTAVSLSGGLDSSALTVVSYLLLEQDVRPFSLIFPGHPETDEQPYIDAVGERIGVSAVKVQPGRAHVETFSDWTKRWRDVPPLPADAAAMPLWRAMSGQGRRVAFTGAGGDYIFCGTPFHYADLVRRGAFMSLAREWPANVRAGSSARVGTLAATGIWPALPVGVKRMLRPLARRAAPAFGADMRWLKLPRPAAAPVTPPRGGSFSTEAILRDLTSGMHAYFLQSASRAAGTAGIELRYPLLDVRLVDFLLAIPEDQRRRDGLQKWLLRRTLAHELPAAVRARTTKADFSHVALQVFESAGPEFYRELRLADLGWVDGAAVLSMLERMRHRRTQADSGFGDDVPALWAVTALELWIRAL